VLGKAVKYLYISFRKQFLAIVDIDNQNQISFKLFENIEKKVGAKLVLAIWTSKWT